VLTLPGTPQWRYCAKVGIAAALGYLLSVGGDNQYAIYSTFTAALIVGGSVGEDFATSGNRVRGTIAGMAAGLAVSAFFGPSAFAVGFAAALTALLALFLGWGIPVARIGVTLCIVSIVAHGVHGLEYDSLRAANTLLGVAVGLAVSFFLWPVRARDEVERASQRVLEAAARLLEAMSAGEPDLRAAELRLYESIGAVVKAGRDARLERRLRLARTGHDAAALEILQLGLDVLAAALAAEGHAGEPGPRPALDALVARHRHVSKVQ
jgi:uncharacterized membrane protein YccC